MKLGHMALAAIKMTAHRAIQVMHALGEIIVMHMDHSGGEIVVEVGESRGLAVDGSRGGDSRGGVGVSSNPVGGTDGDGCRGCCSRP
jgi:hypothetical protein